MDIKIITKFEDFLKLENVWNSVLEESQSNWVCLTFEWFKSWWEAFGKNKSLFILLVKDGSDIVGIAPLMISRIQYRGLPVREISFIENDNSPRTDFLLAEKSKDIIDTLIKYLKVNKDNWNVIQLNNIPKESPTYGILQDSLIRNRVLFGIKEGLRSPYIRIDSDWQTYFSNRSKNLRKDLRYRMNILKKSGHYSIEKVKDTTNNKGILTKIFEISKNSWKSKYHKEITNNMENKRFFEELSQTSSQRGWLVIWLLNINGKSVACEYHLKYKNKVITMRADFDTLYKNNSPGSVLHMFIAKDAFENNLKEYDMCGSEDYYKKRWTSLVREHFNFIIYNDSFFGKLLYLLEFKFISTLKKSKLISKLRNIFKKDYQR